VDVSVRIFIISGRKWINSSLLTLISSIALILFEFPLTILLYASIIV